MSRQLYREILDQGIEINSVCEVGVYNPVDCSSIDVIAEGVPVTLIECDPECVAKLRANYQNRSNVEIIDKAIWHEEKQLTFYRTNASTFCDEVDGSPAVINDQYQQQEMDRFVVQAVPFSSVDSGCYDLVLVDIEGAEWNVLSTMKSRPKVLCLEMRAGEYKNPNTDKIDRWLEENHYQLWKHHNTDSIYILDSVKLNSPRKFFTTISNSHVLFHHWLKAKRRKLRKKIKKIFRIN